MASALATISDKLSIAVASLVLMWSQLILLNISFKSEKETKWCLLFGKEAEDKIHNLFQSKRRRNP